MKVGDKVICKINYFIRNISYINVYDSLVFMEGGEYEIVSMSKDFCEIYSKSIGRSFSIDYKKFGCWFLTKSEIRKKKLEKLNGSMV